ncbi:MAG: helix-turn-helix domain-containing protein [Planctomycetota bacterium]|jgi:excisionase family DNA binding protein|nr:helix-turn-helix domain-containing protein [Planctomycetota bacterium]
MDNEIMNLEQVIEFFGVSERTMIKLLREERIPARKIGREWRFSRTALLEWLREGNSVDYQNQAEQFRVATDTTAATSDLLEEIQKSAGRLMENGANIRALLPDLKENVSLPGKTTLRISYKREREVEKLTFKVFWLLKDFQ